MGCNEFVLFDLQQQTRYQFCEWPHLNNEHWKSVVFKFASVSQAVLFNADRITYNVECAWYWLSTRIRWKLHCYCMSRDCNRGISVLYLVTNSPWITQNYANFILTVGCIGVSIYCNVDIGFKIFDSHARDVYGRAHPQGTCLLLEALSLDSLVCYFQNLYNNMFKVKGVHFNAVPNSIVLPQDYAHETVNFNLLKLCCSHLLSLLLYIEIM